ncbi:MAG: glycosyltransferase family A protein [Acidimicrobiia bacterium]
MSDGQAPILYIAPWVDLGGSDSATIDWFKHVDRARWAPSLITTTPSPNRSLRQVEPYAEEIWNLPDLMSGGAFPEFILGFIESRAVRVVHIVNSRLAFDLLPDMTCLPEPPAVVAELRVDESDRVDYVRYVTRRYGNLIDAFSVAGEDLAQAIAGQEIPLSKVDCVPGRASPAEAAEQRNALYDGLLSKRIASSQWRNEELFGEEDPARDEPLGTPPPPVQLGRDPLPERTVGIVVPCYRHGIFLDACIASVKAQTLRPAAIVVVDDGSSDPETVEALARLDDDPEVTVLRQPENAGPSAARNRGIEQLDTSYVLPIDADDQLIPDALERMLAQLEAAPEGVGFVYPSWRHIGNQSEEVHPPAYNPWLLMMGNYCAAPAFFDRRLFAQHGFRYPEEIVVGHEDWDLILQLAERSVHGVPADDPTFLYRRQGFSRVNAVDYGPDAFERTIERRHPHLYRHRDAIKARWAPALSIVLLDDSAGAWGADDLSGLERQTGTDFEALARTELREGVRAVDGMAESNSPGASLQAAIDAARGRWVLLLPRSAAAVLDQPSFVEQVIHSFVANGNAFALVLADMPGLSRAFFGQLDNAERLSAKPGAIVFERPLWGRAPEIPLGVEVSPFADLAVGLRTIGPVQWRVAPVGTEGTPWLVDPPERRDDPGQIDINLPRCADRSEAAMRHMVVHQAPRLPELTPGTVRRWKQTEPWTPPQTQLLYRFIDPRTQFRTVLADKHPPPGYMLERILGNTHLVSLPDTKRVVHANHSFKVTDRQGELVEGEYQMGYVEQEPLVLMDPLELRRVPGTEQETLVAGRGDPLFHSSEPLETLGWIEACPILPRGSDILHTGPWAVVSLRRQADARGWRHSYSVGAADVRPGEGDIGSLRRYPGPGMIALRLRPDGRLDSELCVPGRASRDPRKVARWIAEPLRPGRGSAGMKGVALRARYLTLHHRARRLAGNDGETLGYLCRENIPGCSTLYSTIHPVTGDQLVTRFPQEATDEGYLMDGILGAIFDPPSGDAASGAPAP